MDLCEMPNFAKLLINLMILEKILSAGGAVHWQFADVSDLQLHVWLQL